MALQGIGRARPNMPCPCTIGALSLALAEAAVTHIGGEEEHRRVGIKACCHCSQGRRHPPLALVPSGVSSEKLWERRDGGPLVALVLGTSEPSNGGESESRSQ
jgi:hypothetical protein